MWLILFELPHIELIMMQEIHPLNTPIVGKHHNLAINVNFIVFIIYKFLSQEKHSFDF